ncbi:tRNA (adenosine(37)-N6)-threonylcarbamoyltransferase complex ATPase subunit type 1 TsaE [Haloflavibacter putidus]|uniref:tRNA threonylcarbamoyladenosine biosynthesis protein TsaE n=1 Tax=Haloflavibacter putidus TaxID=2576776 RepID=A0A507ZNF8_9FLAO|nr:tRNA (adenosine(37)-N6)-threonylcarbamoyltransferase complex ATPase subunit type 1 TsaE [Haloflavibacter putidus]TQD39070.1 tRNA (adenosine(37)-N6)-threonylcarbamoyltransferase complex ATPase subunit type 1 TsaE [Haloflavibacter putidus]
MNSVTYTIDELPKVAKEILEADKSHCLLFYGDLGAGKTTLIKEIVKQLGSTDRVSSPTFSLVNQYEAKKSSIFHFDFYRIEDEEEAYDIGFEEYLDSNAYKLIEWPEKIKNLLPENCTQLLLTKKGEHKRNLKLLR